MGSQSIATEQMPVGLTRRLFDVDEYHQMGRTGILSEDDRVELIEGEIITMTPIGPRHNAGVNRATRALVTAVGDRAIVQVQGSVRLNRSTEPHPDIALFRPRPDFYASRLPGPSDILVIVEVAESSLDYDRGVKATLYAAAGVPEYWLVDLGAGRLTRFTRPSSGAYHERRDYTAGQAIAPEELPDCGVPVDVFLIV